MGVVWERPSGIRVGFTVMGEGKMNEGLERSGVGRMEGDAMVNGTVDISEDIFGGGDMTRKRARRVGGQE